MEGAIKKVDREYFEQKAQDCIALFQEEQQRKSEMFDRIRNDIQQSVNNFLVKLEQAESNRMQKESAEFQQHLYQLTTTLEDAMNIEASLKALRNSLVALGQQLPSPSQ